MNTHTSRGEGLRPLLLSALMSLSLCAPLGCADAHLHARYLHASAHRPQPPSITPLEGEAQLSRSRLIQAVLARHPSLREARSAWGQALARYPQATALPDPTLTLEAAPFTLASAHPYGQTLRLTQRLSHPEAVSLKGAVSLAQAEARREGLSERRLSLCASASALFDEYALVKRLITLNGEHDELVEQLQRSVEASYQVGGGAQRASLSATLERAELKRERNALVAREGRALAELNGLLNQPANASLPPPTPLVELPPHVEGDEAWRARLAELPELRAANKRVEAQRSALALAERAHLPDLSVGLTYSSMWAQPAHRLMVGASITLPVQRAAKRAEVTEATEALTQAEARAESLASSEDVKAQRARVALQEARREALIFSASLLPTARRLVQEAEAAYVSGRGALMELLGALRQLKRLERAEAEVQALAWQRYATLQRALGRECLGSEAPREGGDA